MNKELKQFIDKLTLTDIYALINNPHSPQFAAILDDDLYETMEVNAFTYVVNRLVNLSYTQLKETGKDDAASVLRSAFASAFAGNIHEFYHANQFHIKNKDANIINKLIEFTEAIFQKNNGKRTLLSAHLEKLCSLRTAARQAISDASINGASRRLHSAMRTNQTLLRQSQAMQETAAASVRSIQATAEIIGKFREHQEPKLHASIAALEKLLSEKETDLASLKQEEQKIQADISALRKQLSTCEQERQVIFASVEKQKQALATTINLMSTLTDIGGGVQKQQLVSSIQSLKTTIEQSTSQLANIDHTIETTKRAIFSEEVKYGAFVMQMERHFSILQGDIQKHRKSLEYEQDNLKKLQDAATFIEDTQHSILINAGITARGLIQVDNLISASQGTQVSLYAQVSNVNREVQQIIAAMNGYAPETDKHVELHKKISELSPVDNTSYETLTQLLATPSYLTILISGDPQKYLIPFMEKLLAAHYNHSLTIFKKISFSAEDNIRLALYKKHFDVLMDGSSISTVTFRASPESAIEGRAIKMMLIMLQGFVDDLMQLNIAHLHQDEIATQLANSNVLLTQVQGLRQRWLNHYNQKQLVNLTAATKADASAKAACTKVQETITSDISPKVETADKLAKESDALAKQAVAKMTELQQNFGARAPEPGFTPVETAMLTAITSKYGRRFDDLQMLPPTTTLMKIKTQAEAATAAITGHLATLTQLVGISSTHVTTTRPAETGVDSTTTNRATASMTSIIVAHKTLFLDAYQQMVTFIKAEITKAAAFPEQKAALEDIQTQLEACHHNFMTLNELTQTDVDAFMTAIAAYKAKLTQIVDVQQTLSDAQTTMEKVKTVSEQTLAVQDEVRDTVLPETKKDLEDIAVTTGETATLTQALTLETKETESNVNLLQQQISEADNLLTMAVKREEETKKTGIVPPLPADSTPLVLNDVLMSEQQQRLKWAVTLILIHLGTQDSVKKTHLTAALTILNQEALNVTDLKDTEKNIITACKMRRGALSTFFSTQTSLETFRSMEILNQCLGIESKHLQSSYKLEETLGSLNKHSPDEQVRNIIADAQVQQAKAERSPLSPDDQKALMENLNKLRG